MLLNNKIESPYNKFVPEGSIPIISKAWVKSRLSNKFYELTSKELNELNNPYNISSPYISKPQSQNSPSNEHQKVYSSEKGESQNYFSKGKSTPDSEKDLEDLKSTIIKLKSEMKV